MHLKEAKDKNKMAQFISENEKRYPRASKHHFLGLIKATALGTAKPKKGTQMIYSMAFRLFLNILDSR
jgi:hypothetical protein